MSQRSAGPGNTCRVSRTRQRGMGCSWDAAEMEFVDIGLEVAHKWTKAEENGKIWDSGKRALLQAKNTFGGVMLVYLASFSTGLSDTLLGGTLRLAGVMNDMDLLKCSGPLCISTWNLTMLHHKTFLFRHCYYICIFICIHILLKKLKYKNEQNKEWL